MRPLTTATVAYGVTGAMLLLKRRKERQATVGSSGPAQARADGEALSDPRDLKRLAKDQSWFLPIFVVKVALGLVAFAFKPALGVLFFAANAVYFWREIRSSRAEDDGQDEGGELEPPEIRRTEVRRDPRRPRPPRPGRPRRQDASEVSVASHPSHGAVA